MFSKTVCQNNGRFAHTKSYSLIKPAHTIIIISILTLPGSVSARRSFISWMAVSVKSLKAFTCALFCDINREIGSSHGRLSVIDHNPVTRQVQYECMDLIYITII